MLAQQLTFDVSVLLPCRQTSRTRQDQAQAPGAGKLQPTSVMAAAAAALNAGGAVGKAAAKAVGIPLNTRSNSGALCSAEYRDTAVPAQHNFAMGVPAAAAAVAGGAPATWQQPSMQQMQVEGHAAGAVNHTPRALHAAPSNDTSQSGIDCTPRQHSGTAAGAAGMGAAGHATLSAAAPMVTTGATVAARLSSSNISFTPRAMETDAPGLGGQQSSAGIAVTKQQVVSVLANGQQPQVVVQQQRSSTHDVHGPDQAALMAASNLMKAQASMAAAAAAAGGSSNSTAPTYLASTALQGQGMLNMGITLPQQHQQQAAFVMLQRQQAAVAAAMQQQQQQLQEGAWAEQQVAASQLDMTAPGAASRAAAVLSSATGVSQQVLLQQLLQQQELAAMGYGVGSSAINQPVQPMQTGQEQFGGAGSVMVDRLLPRLQR